MRKKQYQQKKKFYWGLKPEKGLKRVLEYAEKGLALDIGAGEGRNSLFLAKNGFKVEAIDKVKEGLKKCKEYAKKYNLPIKTKVIDIRKFKFEKEKYSLIFSVTSIDFLKFSEIKRIIKKIKTALKKGGILYLVVFSTKDPSFKKIKEKGIKTIEKNTFYFPKIKMVRHYFEKKELLELLKDFEIIKIEEEYKKDTHEKIHFHNIIGVVAKK
jgi:cyclopropane fatty-acyl-phospholipid synthase-like methyltransferase